MNQYQTPEALSKALRQANERATKLARLTNAARHSALAQRGELRQPATNRLNELLKKPGG